MPSQPSSAYIHTLTSSFASTLDEIPQDMCRHFADLRELDAVLSQSLSGITSRIDQLTEKIENGLASIDSRNNADGDGSGQDSSESKEEKVIDMFRLLHEIAEDTGRIKLGGEDKIRVASLAAEHMNVYHSHLLTVVRRMYELDAAYALEILAPNTQYPHVHPSALIDPAPENRRGAPRRTVAVQNNSYGLPIETVGRVNGANGDTPTKRRRVLNQSHLARERENDTDDYDTPRRGAAAADSEPYRPGGNTASKTRVQGRKREARVAAAQATMVESTTIPGPEPLGRQPVQGSANSMQGVEPTNAGPSHSKPHNQSSRNRVQSSQATQPQMPQQYPSHYHQQPFVGLPGQMQFAGPPNSYPLPMMPAGSNATGNINPAMDAAYHAMNMNPNLNHGPAVGYAHVGMGLPASLPPPPGSGHSRPHSASLGGRNAQSTGYESGPAPTVTGSGTGRNNIQTPNVDQTSGGHVNIKSRVSSGAVDGSNAQGGSSSGGLVSVPMTLPPVTALTQQPPMGSLSHQPQSSNDGRQRGYSTSAHNQAYSSSTYNSLPEGHRPGSSSAYAPQGSGNHPSLSPVTSNQAQPGYGSSAGPGSYMDKGMTGRGIGQMEAHPSLVSPVTAKDSARGAPPRDMPGAIHASLDRRDRDPPFRTHSAGSGEREKEREHKSNRPRTNTVTLASAPPKYEEGYPTSAPNVVDRNREGHPSSYNNRGPAIFHDNPSTANPPSHANLQPQPSRSTTQRDAQPPKMEERDTIGGPGKGTLNLDRLVDDREREGRGIDRETHSMSRGAPQDDSERNVAMTHDDMKTPIRRRTANEATVPRDGNFNDGGEVVEGQVIDDDSKPYCICHQPSFGQMIACDDSECEYEWFHLACLGITGTPPQGDFICEACRTRRQKGSRKTGRKKGNGAGNGRGRAL